MNPAPSAPKYVSQPAQPAPGRSPPISSGPMTNNTTSPAEMAISVINALRPLPNSMLRPNATCIWSRSRVV